MNHTDPLRRFLQQHHYHPDEIGEIVIGEKYLACRLKNGDLGICATLLHQFPENYTHRLEPDPNVLCDRILLNAWLNAKLNNRGKEFDQGDIFDHNHFDADEQVVMIGYFAPLIRKFHDGGVPLAVFDYHQRPDTLPLNQQKAFLQQSKTIILTSTTISNGSFSEIIKNKPVDASVLLLGPSSILDQEMFQFQGIKGIYGMIFNQYQKEVMKSIALGSGTPEFSKFGTKVFMRNEF